MGGKILDSFEEKEDIDFLLIGGEVKTEKLNKAIKKNIPLVSVQWVDMCWFYNFKLAYQVFEVDKDNLGFCKKIYDV